MENLGEDDRLKCPVCLAIPLGEIFQCYYGHTVCDQCYYTVKHCPVCSVEYEGERIRNRQLEYILDKTKFPCANKELGCGSLVLRNEISSHAMCCSYGNKKINICKLIGIEGCNFLASSDNPKATLNHFRLEHDAPLNQSGNMILHHMDFATLVKSGVEVLNGVRSRYWTPVIIQPKVWQESGQGILVLGFLNGNTETVSWLCLSVGQVDDDATNLVTFVVSPETDKRLTWGQCTVDLLGSKPFLENKLFQTPIPILLDHVVRDGSLLLRISSKLSQDIDSKPDNIYVYGTPTFSTLSQKHTPQASKNSTCDICTGLIYGPRFNCLQCHNITICHSCMRFDRHANHLFALVRPGDQNERILKMQWSETDGWKNLFPNLLSSDKLKSWLQSNSCTIFADTTCDGCSKLPISGTRYKCLECVSYNLCQSCVDSGTFHVEHILGVIMNAHVNEFVTSIQKPGKPILPVTRRREKLRV